MHLIIQYTIALANLYGIYDRTLLLNIYNRQNNENVTPEELIGHFRDAAFALKKAKIVLKGQQIIKSEIIDDDFYDELIELKNGKDYYIPEREILLNYQDEDYIERSPQYNALKSFTVQFIDEKRRRDADEIVHKIAIMCRDGYRMQKIVDYMAEQSVLIDSEDDADVLFKVVFDMMNASRIWQNNGFKPNDFDAPEFIGEFDTTEYEMPNALSVMNYIFEKNQELVFAGLPYTRLKDQLACRTVVQLKWLADIIELRGVSSLRKAQLIDALAESLIKEYSLHLGALLVEFESYEMEVLKKALKQDYIALDEMFLYYDHDFLICGYAQISYLDGQYYYALAEEIKPLIEPIIKSKAFRYRYYLKRVAKTLESIILIYGVLRVDDIVTLIQSRERDLTATKTLLNAVEIVVNRDEKYELVDDFVVAPALVLLLGEVKNYQSRQMFNDMVGRLTVNYDHIPLAEFDADYLAEFISNDYMDMTPALRKIKDLLREETTQELNKYDDYEQLLYEMLFVVNANAKQALPLDLIHDLLSNGGYAPKSYAEFDALYIEHVKTVKSWCIKGHNKESLETLGYSFEKYVPSVKSGTVIRKTKKVGRNDPCPCGSGKKYKKCCMKLL